MPRVLKTREFVKRMRELGVEVKEGKGSEIKLLRPGCHLYTVKGHGSSGDVHKHVVRSACQRLGIPLDEFWKGV